MALTTKKILQDGDITQQDGDITQQDEELIFNPLLNLETQLICSITRES